MLQLRPQTSSDRKEQDYLFGYNLRIAGEPIRYCKSVDAQRGWQAAKQGELDAADAETECYLVRTGEIR